jgi:hypothetical protein
MRAVILAAGVGSRLRPRTDDRPKAMVEVGGVPLLVRLAKQLAAVGVDELIIGTGYFEEAIAKILPSLPMRAVLCRNEAYDRTQNIVSFHECRAALLAGSTRETLQLDRRRSGRCSHGGRDGAVLRRRLVANAGARSRRPSGRRPRSALDRDRHARRPRARGAARSNRVTCVTF